ncbi:adenylate kinase 4-like [Iris pallida]|uniref:Adenylate kinase 4-like n=1 Tax=Iris pallida TaxID=29817 RepID=A0AAX6ETE5_IRIPA|nr:adenylate kinase 4-like [Iris pallida]
MNFHFSLQYDKVFVKLYYKYQFIISFLRAMMSLACAMRGIHNVGGLTKNGHNLSWRGTEWGVPCMKTHRLGRRAGGRGPAPFYHGYKRRLSTRPVVRHLIGVGKTS